MTQNNYDRKKKIQLSGRLCFLVGLNYNRKKLRPEKKKSIPKTIRRKNVFQRVQITTGKNYYQKIKINPKQSAGKNSLVPVPAKIWRELAPYYFPADCFELKKLIPKQCAGK
jgi:hypothetical protein